MGSCWIVSTSFVRVGHDKELVLPVTSGGLRSPIVSVTGQIPCSKSLFPTRHKNRSSVLLFFQRAAHRCNAQHTTIRSPRPECSLPERLPPFLQAERFAFQAELVG